MPQIVRLLSGSFSDTETKDVSDSVIEKPVMLVYEGKFMSMDGEVDVTKDHIENLASNHNGLLAKFARMATGEIPLKECPPIQLDHSVSARDTVGRLVGNLDIGEYDDGEGKKKALYGKLRIMGKENVEKVKDGRWTHVSIGADLEAGKLTELSITPFPAAPKASMLRAKLASEKKVNTQTINGVPVDIYAMKQAGEIFYYCAIDGDPVCDPQDSIKQAVDEAKKFIQKASKMSRMSKTKVDPNFIESEEVVKVRDDAGYAVMKGSFKGKKGFFVYDDATDSILPYMFDSANEADQFGKNTYMSIANGLSKKTEFAKWSVVLPSGADIEVNAESAEEAIAKAEEGKGKQVGVYSDKPKKPKAVRLASRVIFREKYKGETYEVVLKNDEFFYRVEGLLNGQLQRIRKGLDEDEAVWEAKKAARDMIDDVQGL
jgi:hypothetical protein